MSAKNPEWEKFGAQCGGSRWFEGDPTIVEKPVVMVRVVWPCPVQGCAGEMKFNGMTWPTGDPGYHHTCTQCRFTAAIRGHQYPGVEYREKVE